jgi:hypothetical protein
MAGGDAVRAAQDTREGHAYVRARTLGEKRQDTFFDPARTCF